ncbi:hypothetical protein FUAX_04500 [Fulvitalea axinellae]|uniref:Transposase IS30-like HTH domain-containing protein n=1 Tax=Fulvitalea axinellae TaxID=1182444 RepID=A0AAU9CWQ5_9BACT|nr:hypothetical protein FUAX_04500 [Fulvitalea axinellae]
MRTYNQLSQAERIFIARYTGYDMSVRWIAKAIRRAPSTISRELVRNGMGPHYCAETAHKLFKARKRMAVCGAIYGKPRHLRLRYYLHNGDRNLTRWLSDLNDYYRTRESFPAFQLIKRMRRPSLFAPQEKPNNIFSIREDLALLALQMEINARHAKAKPISNGRHVSPPQFTATHPSPDSLRIGRYDRSAA